MHVGGGLVGARLHELRARRRQIALLDVQLLAVGARHGNLRFRRAHLVFQGFHGGVGGSHGGVGQIAVLRGGHAAVEQALLALVSLLIAPEIGLGLHELGARRRREVALEAEAQRQPRG